MKLSVPAGTSYVTIIKDSYQELWKEKVGFCLGKA